MTRLPVVAPKNPIDPGQLSIKQKLFADKILDGKNATLADVYRDVYQTKNMSPRTVRNEASNLYRHPGVTAYIERARERVEADRARRAVGEREAVRTRLWSEAEEADRSSDRLTALKESKWPRYRQNRAMLRYWRSLRLRWPASSKISFSLLSLPVKRGGPKPPTYTQLSPWLSADKRVLAYRVVPSLSVHAHR